MTYDDTFENEVCLHRHRIFLEGYARAGNVLPWVRAEWTGGGREETGRGRLTVHSKYFCGVFAFHHVHYYLFPLEGSLFLFVLFHLRKQILSIKKLTVTFGHSATPYQLTYMQMKCKWARKGVALGVVLDQLNNITEDQVLSTPLCRLSVCGPGPLHGDKN